MSIIIPSQARIASCPAGHTPHILWRAFMLVCALCIMMVAASPVFAQTPQSNGAGGAVLSHVSLRDTGGSFDLGRSVFVIADPAQNMAYARVMESYRAGRGGAYGSGPVLTLGSRPMGYWLLVSIANESAREDWVLSLGENMTGRLGQIGNMFIYDESTNTRLIDTISSTRNPYANEGMILGAATPIKIGRGKRMTLVMYVVPEPGLPLAIAPRMIAADHFAGTQGAAFSLSRLVPVMLLMMAGLFAGGVVFRRMWGGLFFVVFYLLQVLLYRLHNDTILTPQMLSTEFLAALYALTAVTGICAAQAFLDIGRYYNVQRQAIAVAILGIILSTMAGTFVIGASSAMKPVMLLAPATAGYLFISLLSLAQGQNGKYAAYQFALAWLFPFAGVAVTAMALLGVIEATPMTMGAYWLSLVPQAVLLLSASVTRALMKESEEEEERLRAESEVESISQLKQSRDASENARLLRVIEHERQVMNELREREMQQNEEMRKARDSADEANRAKSAFLAVISHEIRTPMSGIMGMVRLLLDTSLTLEQKDYAQTIQDSGDAMLSLLNDILDFEKIESGKMDLETIDFDLPRMIQGIVTLMSGHAETKKIALKAEISPDLPRFVVGDPVRMRQVLLNLVGNSIKFTDSGGVTLHVKMTQGDKAQGGVARIRFAVQDTGVGISPEAQKNLFNPFSQADSSVSRRFGGTGLGLAISQRLIEAMGGKIAIDSVEGQGSTFYFTVDLPEGVADGAGQADGTRDNALHGKSSKAQHILIVEDNEINQKLMKEFIQRMGHSFVIVGTGEDGLASVNDNDYDLVLMDMELPGISGIGATKAIRALADRKKARLPVIAMTGNVRDEDIHSCYAANMNGHIAKPIDPQKLREQIQKVIDNRLDNPVVVEDDDEDSGTEAHGAEIRLPANEPVLTPPAKVNLRAEGDVARGKAPQSPDMAPPREMLMTPAAFALKDLEIDLDEDSFTAAITDDEPAPPAEPEAEAAPPEPPPAEKLAAAETAPLSLEGADDDLFSHAAAEKHESSTSLLHDALNSGTMDDEPAPAAPQAPSPPDILHPDNTAPLTLMLEEEDEVWKPAAAAAPAPEMPDLPEADNAIETPAAPPYDRNVFDDAVLGGLRGVMDHDALAAMIAELFEKAEQIIDDLLAGAAAKDGDLLAMRGHELKGMAGNFGLKEISRIAADIETHARADNLDAIAPITTFLRPAYERGHKAMGQWLAG